MGEVINFFGTSTRSSAERLSIIKRYSKTDVTPSYMEYGEDYFDNPDHTLGYHGYKYDGRYAEPVSKIIDHYGLAPGSEILEVGCAKGFVLVEFLKQGMSIQGLDRSSYAVENAHPDVKEYIRVGDIAKMPFGDKAFDFVLVKEILPHIPPDNLVAALKECLRVSKARLFFEIQCGRTNTELENMKQWDRTHKVIQPPEWWDDLFLRQNIPCDKQYNILVPDA